MGSWPLANSHNMPYFPPASTGTAATSDSVVLSNIFSVDTTVSAGYSRFIPYYLTVNENIILTVEDTAFIEISRSFYN